MTETESIRAREARATPWTEYAQPLVDLLADMHDSADDESCLADGGDGSCFACQSFAALAEYDKYWLAALDEANQRIAELEKAVQSWRRKMIELHPTLLSSSALDEVPSKFGDCV